MLLRTTIGPFKMMVENANRGLAVVVEDEWLIRMQIADALTNTGWEVGEFSDGYHAIEFLPSAPIIDLLVTDIRLPGVITGWDIARVYRHYHPGIRVIYCSGNPVDERKRMPESVFLPKPCDMEKLLRASRTGT